MIDTRDLRKWQSKQTTEAREWDKPEQAWSEIRDASVVPLQGSEPRETLLILYIERAMLRAVTKQYPEDGMWFAEVPRIPDVWGNGGSEDAAIQNLKSTLRAWIEWKIEDRDEDIPPLDGVDLNIL